ncbi:MAG: hypothetical protein ACI4WY_05500 [Anaerovoracaceae bacterium]
MAKVELSYNPYLLETKVTFNGNTPRINSLIEKYSGGSLYNWIEDMPHILHDEMNGYDFQLIFSGTDKEYETVKATFKDIPDVEIFHRNHLDSRYEKCTEIDHLLMWLVENKNRQLDYEAFRSSHVDLFDSAYPFLILNGGKVDQNLFAGLNVSSDNIDNLDTVEDTDLKNVPILVCVNQDSISKLEDNVEILLMRKDISDRQLFFLIHPSLNARKVERLLKDSGIPMPQIIESNDISLITDYMELFPITEYIRESILLFKALYENMKTELDQQLADNELAGKDIRSEIDTISNGIDALKQSYEQLLNRDNLDTPNKCKEAVDFLQSQIKNWRKRKTKITRDEEAEKYAAEFEQDIADYYAAFMEKIDQIFDLQRTVLEKSYLETYRQAEFDRDYIPNAAEIMISREKSQLPDAADFVKLKHEKYVEQNDIFDSFLSSNTKIELVREVTYYIQEWRDYAESKILPIAEDYIEAKFQFLCEHENSFAKDLMEHLSNLITDETEKKKSVVAQMSEKDRQLQTDADWLSKINDMLEVIMRG